MSIIRLEGDRTRDQESLAALVADLVAGSRVGLLPSLVWTKALVMKELAPATLEEESDRWDEWKRFRRSLEPQRNSSGRYELKRAVPGISVWRRVGLPGGPTVLGSPERRGASHREVVAKLKPRLMHATPDQVRRVLEGQLAEALAARSEVAEVVAGVRGNHGESDLVVRMTNDVPVNIECRNRRNEILDGIPAKDRERYRRLIGQGMASVLVTGAVSHQARAEMDVATHGFGGYVEMGIYVAPTPKAWKSLVEMEPPFLPVMRLPEAVVDLVVAELVRVAEKWREEGSGVTGQVDEHDGDQELATVTALPRGHSRISEVLALADEGLTQEEIADQLDVTSRTIKRWLKEAGVEWPGGRWHRLRGSIVKD